MYLTPPRPRVLAHRGFTAPEHPDVDIVENTIRAFDAAVELGVTYIESDVRSTRDGVAVLLHDADFISDQSGAVFQINELMFDELDQIRLSNGDRIPSVTEVLERYPDTRFNLDVKESAAIEPLIRAISQTSASSRVLVTSFSGSRRRQTRARLTHTFAGASSGQAWLIAFALLTRQQWVLRALARDIHAAQLPNNGVTRAVLSAKNIERLHREDLEVHIWTLNTADEMTFWLQRGVAGIVTDRSDTALELIRSRGFGREGSAALVAEHDGVSEA